MESVETFNAVNLELDVSAVRVAEKVGDVKHLVSHNDPAILVGVVLGDLLSTDRHDQIS